MSLWKHVAFVKILDLAVCGVSTAPRGTGGSQGICFAHLLLAVKVSQRRGNVTVLYKEQTVNPAK